jgi:hypothetical protein
VKLQWHQRSQYTLCLRAKDSLLWRSGVDTRPEDIRDHFIKYNSSARSSLRVSLLSRYLQTLASITSSLPTLFFLDLHRLLALSYHDYYHCQQRLCHLISAATAATARTIPYLTHTALTVTFSRIMRRSATRTTTTPTYIH